MPFKHQLASLTTNVPKKQGSLFMNKERAEKDLEKNT